MHTGERSNRIPWRARPLASTMDYRSRDAEPDARIAQIIDVEEEGDPAGVPIADRGDLMFAVGAGQEDAGLCARRADEMCGG